uniref:DUF86 domain-containing protein n=1 Tax=candidate division WOR-3 bacterium TaxID=2052148 RepID=A0A7V4E510_UNCW3
MRIIDLIIRFESHINNAKFVVTKDISDYFVYNTLAMECFQAVNSLIEIGEWIVAERKLGFPSTYREIFELLYNNKIINKEIFESIKRLIFLRNLIAHEYYKITKDELVEMVDLLKIAEKFVKEVKEKQR